VVIVLLITQFNIASADECSALPVNSKAYNDCMLLDRLQWVLKKEYQQLQIELNELILKSKKGEITTSKVLEKLKASQVHNIEIKRNYEESLGLQKELDLEFNEYKWQVRMRWVLPILIGGLAQELGAADNLEDRALWFSAGMGVGFAAESSGIGVSKWAGSMVFEFIEYKF
jgi:hypothetical protein